MWSEGKIKITLCECTFILSEKSLAIPDCFPIYLLNAEIMESCTVCSETGFKSNQLCMKTFVVVIDAEESRGRIYSKGTRSKIALWHYR